MIGRILVFGDSIGQGFYDETNGGWVHGIYPNPNGHELIYNEVKRKLDEML